MSTPFYSDAAARLALSAEVKHWLGTPFRGGSMVAGVGGGVDCIRLTYSLHLGAGAFEPFELPAGRPLDWHLHHDDSAILDFFGEPRVRSRLHAVDRDDPPIFGDLLAVEVGRCIHHLGTFLDVSSGRFICHVPRGGVVELTALTHPMIKIAGIWRITRP
jgi:hypothetical protein